MPYFPHYDIKCQAFEKNYQNFFCSSTSLSGTFRIIRWIECDIKNERKSSCQLLVIHVRYIKFKNNIEYKRQTRHLIYSVLGVKYMNALHTVSRPRWQTNKKYVYYYGSPTPHVSTTQCAQIEIKTHLLSPLIYIFFIFLITRTDVRCVDLPTATWNPPPSPTTAEHRGTTPAQDTTSHVHCHTCSHTVYISCV